MRIIIICILFSIGVLTISAIVITQDRAEPKVTYLTSSDFLAKITNSDAEYHLLYSYAYWCKPCKETMPKLMNLLTNNTDIAFYPFIVEKEGSPDIAINIEELKQKHNYTSEVYAADISHGRKHYQRYKKFINGIAPNLSEYGMSLILLFNKKGKLLYSTNYHQSSQQKMEGLEEVLALYSFYATGEKLPLKEEIKVRELIAMAEFSPDIPNNTALRIIESFKGVPSSGEYILIQGEYEFKLGERYLIFADSLKNGFEFAISPHSYTSTIDDVNSETLKVLNELPCIDPSKINPGVCTREYNPMCGCDGVTYGNPCDLRRNGVQKYTPGECK